MFRIIFNKSYAVGEAWCHTLSFKVYENKMYNNIGRIIAEYDPFRCEWMVEGRWYDMIGFEYLPDWVDEPEDDSCPFDAGELCCTMYNDCKAAVAA